VTREAPIHDNVKQALVNAGERDTRLLFRTLNNTARVWRNAVADEVLAIEGKPGGCTFDEVRQLVAGVKGRHALETGELNAGVITAGTVLGLIDDIPSCAELVERIVADCRAALQRARDLAA